MAEHHKSIQATQTPEARVTLGEQERGKLVLASAAGASQSDRLMRKVEEGARQYRAICAQRGTTYDTRGIAMFFDLDKSTHEKNLTSLPHSFIHPSGPFLCSHPSLTHTNVALTPSTPAKRSRPLHRTPLALRVIIYELQPCDPVLRIRPLSLMQGGAFCGTATSLGIFHRGPLLTGSKLRPIRPRCARESRLGTNPLPPSVLCAFLFYFTAHIANLSLALTLAEIA